MTEIRQPTPDNPSLPHLSLQDTVRQVAATHPTLPINESAALYKFAQENGLGHPLTDEWKFEYQGQAYVAQTFQRGLVYCPKFQWDKVEMVTVEDDER